MSDKGKFIVIEGLDASGKATQSGFLAERFREEGEEVRQVEFPAYDTEFGSLLRDYLDGELGQKEELPSEIRSLLYSLDRYQFKKEFREFLKDGGVLIADRFSQSNYAFQSADSNEPEEMTEWMAKVDSRLPQPDEVIFLDVPPEKTAELMEDREKDMYEDNLEYQRKVYRRYLELAEEVGWKIVDCVEDGQMKSREDISREIWKKIG
jgi:dTMP kinase